MKRNTLKALVLFSQGGLLLITVLLYYLFRKAYWLEDLWDKSFSIPVVVYTGIMAGIGIRLFSIVLGEAWPKFQDSMEETVIIVFRGIDNYDLFLVSFLPAVVEELFFRGFLQPYLGVIITSAIFASFHWGFIKRLWMYGLHTFVISLFLGWLYQASGSLLTTMIAHFINNLVAGFYIQKRINF